MPIYIETPTQLNAEDRQDLEKIYADYPLSAALERLDYLQDADQSQRWKLYVARFNAKLLGAFWLELIDKSNSSSTTESKHAVVHDICVREITRRRGVGERLLSVAKEQHANLSLATPAQEIDDSSAVIALADKLNITITN